MKKRKSDWILTFSGKRFYPLDPHADEMYAADIAHALSLQCRFGGHCIWHYSVAQHSAVGSKHLEAAGHLKEAFKFLFHDASETWMIDLCTPIKRGGGSFLGWLLGYCYRHFENKYDSLLEEAFFIPDCDETIVKHCDKRMLVTEKRDIMCDPTLAWKPAEDKATPFEDEIKQITPLEAEAMWMNQYEKLRKELYFSGSLRGMKNADGDQVSRHIGRPQSCGA